MGGFAADGAAQAAPSTATATAPAAAAGPPLKAAKKKKVRTKAKAAKAKAVPETPSTRKTVTKGPAKGKPKGTAEIEAPQPGSAPGAAANPAKKKCPSRPRAATASDAAPKVAAPKRGTPSKATQAYEEGLRIQREIEVLEPSAAQKTKKKNKNKKRAGEAAAAGAADESATAVAPKVNREQKGNEAIQHFKKAVELGSAQAAMALHRTYSQGIGTKGNADMAREWLQRALQLGSTEAMCHVARAHIRQGAVDAATTVLSHPALDTSTEALRLRAELALCGASLDGVATAIEHLRNAAAQGDAAAQAELTRVLLRSADPNDRAEAHRLSPTHPEVLRQQGSAEEAAGNPGGALALFQQADKAGSTAARVDVIRLQNQLATVPGGAPKEVRGGDSTLTDPQFLLAAVDALYSEGVAAIPTELRDHVVATYVDSADSLLGSWPATPESDHMDEGRAARESRRAAEAAGVHRATEALRRAYEVATWSEAGGQSLLAAAGSKQHLDALWTSVVTEGDTDASLASLDAAIARRFPLLPRAAREMAYASAVPDVRQWPQPLVCRCIASRFSGKKGLEPFKKGPEYTYTLNLDRGVPLSGSPDASKPDEKPSGLIARHACNVWDGLYTVTTPAQNASSSHRITVTTLPTAGTHPAFYTRHYTPKGALLGWARFELASSVPPKAKGAKGKGRAKGKGKKRGKPAPESGLAPTTEETQGGQEAGQGASAAAAAEGDPSAVGRNAEWSGRRVGRADLPVILRHLHCADRVIRAVNSAANPNPGLPNLSTLAPPSRNRTTRVTSDLGDLPLTRGWDGIRRLVLALGLCQEQSQTHPNNRSMTQILDRLVALSDLSSPHESDCDEFTLSTFYTLLLETIDPSEVAGSGDAQWLAGGACLTTQPTPEQPLSAPVPATKPPANAAAVGAMLRRLADVMDGAPANASSRVLKYAQQEDCLGLWLRATELGDSTAHTRIYERLSGRRRETKPARWSLLWSEFPSPRPCDSQWRATTAAKHLELALETDDPSALHWEGLASKAGGASERALEMFERAAKGGHMEARVDAAGILEAADESARAQAHLEAVVALRGSKAMYGAVAQRAAVALGTLLVRVGRRAGNEVDSRGLELLREAASNGEASAMYALGMALLPIELSTVAKPNSPTFSSGVELEAAVRKDFEMVFGRRHSKAAKITDRSWVAAVFGMWCFPDHYTSSRSDAIHYLTYSGSDQEREFFRRLRNSAVPQHKSPTLVAYTHRRAIQTLQDDVKGTADSVEPLRRICETLLQEVERCQDSQAGAAHGATDTTAQEGLKWLQQAGAKGHASALHTLGQLHEVWNEPSEAEECYRRARTATATDRVVCLETNLSVVTRGTDYFVGRLPPWGKIEVELFSGDRITEIDGTAIEGMRRHEVKRLVNDWNTPLMALRVQSCHRLPENDTTPLRPALLSTVSLGKLLCRDSASATDLDEGVGLLESCWRETSDPDTTTAFARGLFRQAHRAWARRDGLDGVTDEKAIALRAHEVCPKLPGVATLLGDIHFRDGDRTAADRWYRTEIANGVSDGAPECGLAQLASEKEVAAEHLKVAADRGSLGATLLHRLAAGSLSATTGDRELQPAVLELCTRGFLTRTILEGLLSCLGAAAVARLLVARTSMDQTLIMSAVAHGHASVVDSIRRFTLDTLVGALAKEGHFHLVPQVAAAPNLLLVVLQTGRYNLLTQLDQFCEYCGDLGCTSVVTSLGRALSKENLVTATEKLGSAAIDRLTSNLRTASGPDRPAMLKDAVRLLEMNSRTTPAQNSFWRVVGNGMLDEIVAGGTTATDPPVEHVAAVVALCTRFEQIPDKLKGASAELPARVLSRDAAARLTCLVGDHVTLGNVAPPDHRKSKNEESGAAWHSNGASFLTTELERLCGEGNASLAEHLGSQRLSHWFANLCVNMIQFDKTTWHSYTLYDFLPILTRCCAQMWPKFTPQDRATVLDGVTYFAVSCEDKCSWDSVLSTFDQEKLETGSAGRCTICTDRLFRPKVAVAPYESEAYSYPGCVHRFCKGCLEHWVTAKVDEYTACVPCPDVDCSCVLSVHDVKRLCKSSVLKRFQALKSQTHVERLRELAEDSELLQQTAKISRCCPHCRVLVYRFAGCTSMSCVCGNYFDWDSPTAQVRRAVEEIVKKDKQPHETAKKRKPKAAASEV